MMDGMVHKITGWCKGYVMVKISGGQAERFINLCRNHGIFWWDLRWNKKREAVFGCVSRQDYYKMRPLVQKTRVFPVVTERFGGVFWLQRAKQRQSFWWGIAGFLFLLFFLSSRIWGIHVEGQSYHSKESMLRYLESIGIYGGMAANAVECSEIEENIRKTFPDIGWASVEKAGSKLYVRLEEVILLEEEAEKKPRSLVAEEDGQVVSIVTRTGTAKVRAGDLVKKNQTLISGKVKIIGDNETLVDKKAVNSQGTVVLRCQKFYEDPLEKNYQRKEYTERELDIYQIQMLGKNLFLYNPLNYLETYEKYDIIREGGQLCPFLSLRFPVSIWKKTYLETNYQPDCYSKKEAKKVLGQRYEYYIEQMKQAGCYEISGELQIQDAGDSWIGSANIVYSKEQESYQEVPLSWEKMGKKNVSQQAE